MTSKNSNYAAAESYLTFQHNEYTGLPILDEKGRPKLRDSYLLDTLECGESSFAMACLIANRKYGKNGGREDVKTHHIWRHPPKRMLIYSCVARTVGHTKYIISFDPKDAVENGLTMERAQALGLQFCRTTSPVIPPSSAPTRTVTTVPGTSTSTSSSAACVSAPWNGSPSWTSRATGKRARSTAALLPCSGTSVSLSWKCASKPT